MGWGCQGSCLLRGVPSQGHSGCPGISLTPLVPVTRVPAPFPGPARAMGGAGGRGCCSLPRASQGVWGWDPGLRGRCEDKEQLFHPVERAAAAQTGLYWEHGAKPSSFPQLPFVSSLSCSGWGTPRNPNSPAAPLSLHPSTALGVLVGTQWCQSPAPSTQGSPGKGHHLQETDGSRAPGGARTRCPRSPCRGIPPRGACGVLPAPIKARDRDTAGNSNVTPSSTLASHSRVASL